jgi:hypothetical protein
MDCRRLAALAALAALAPVASLDGGDRGDGSTGESFPTWDRAHPDAAVPARDNALLAKPHRPLARAGQASCFGGEVGQPRACTTGDAGSGRWEPQGGVGWRWRPSGCRLRYASQRELRCVLGSTRIAMVGDSLVRNLFDGLAHHTGLSVARGVDYGPKAKQRDAYAMHAADDILIQLHWAPCAVPYATEPPPSLSGFGRVQWSDCQAATSIGRETKGTVHRPRDLADILHGYGVRRSQPASLNGAGARAKPSSCGPTAEAQCVSEQLAPDGGQADTASTAKGKAESTKSLVAERDRDRMCAENQPLPPLLALAAAAQAAGPAEGNNISCVVGYAAAVGTSTPRYASGRQDQQQQLTTSCWRQFCNPPQVRVTRFTVLVF